MPLHIVIYICIYSYVRYSKLSQGQSWGNVKLDLKQIGMKERETEDKMLIQEKWQNVGRRKWKIRGLKIINLVTRDRGIKCLLLLREFSHSLEKLSEKAGCRLRKSKTPEWLVKHWYWSFCGNLRFGEIKKDTWGFFLEDLLGRWRRKGNTISQDETVEVSNLTAARRSHILIIPYTYYICSPVQGIYRVLRDGQEKHCFISHSLFFVGQT